MHILSNFSNEGRAVHLGHARAHDQSSSARRPLSRCRPRRSYWACSRTLSVIALMKEYFELSYWQGYAFCLTFLMPFSLFEYCICLAHQRIRPDWRRIQLKFTQERQLTPSREENSYNGLQIDSWPHESQYPTPKMHGLCNSHLKIIRFPPKVYTLWGDFSATCQMLSSIYTANILQSSIGILSPTTSLARRRAQDTQDTGDRIAIHTFRAKIDVDCSRVMFPPPRGWPVLDA